MSAPIPLKLMRYNSNTYNELPYNGFRNFFLTILNLNETISIEDLINQFIGVVREILRKYFQMELKEEILREYFHMYMRENIEVRKYFYKVFGQV